MLKSLKLTLIVTISWQLP